MKLYFVGTASAHKRNSYLAVSNDRSKAEEVANSYNSAHITVWEKEVDVRPRRRRGRAQR